MNDKPQSDAAPADAHGEFKISINGKNYFFERPTISGAEIKAIASIDSDYKLFLEQYSGKDDVPLSNSSSLRIDREIRVYSIPPATFASPLPADVAVMREACANAAADYIGRMLEGGYSIKSAEVKAELLALPIPEPKTDAEPEPIGWYVRCPETGGHLLDTEKIGAERKARECYHPREYHILPVFLSAPSKTDAAVKALFDELRMRMSTCDTSKGVLPALDHCIDATLAANGVKSEP